MSSYIGLCPHCGDRLNRTDIRKETVVPGGIKKATYAFICKKCDHIIGFST